jgi:hypothetical protein
VLDRRFNVDRVLRKIVCLYAFGLLVVKPPCGVGRMVGLRVGTGVGGLAALAVGFLAGMVGLAVGCRNC